jgi:pimeloyl-ACP methyl ester carboxylesterase
MKIYAFSGLGADQRIFTYLQLNAELVPVRWIDPLPDESLPSYAIRLSEQIDQSQPYALLGVSFGGMLVSELSHHLAPKHTILISSAANAHELPWMAFLAKKWHLVKRIPLRLFRPPTLVAWFGFPFHTRNRKVAQGIIRDMDPAFVKWALGAIVQWEREDSPKSFLHIHGRLDPILPLKKRMNAKVIGTGHFIVLKNAEEISKRINSFL